MAIKLTTKLITERLEDSNGKIVGEVKINVNDVKTYDDFLKMVRLLEEVQTKVKNTKVNDIPKKDAKTIEEFEEIGESIETAYNLTSFAVEKIDEIKPLLDQIFGVGTAQLVLGDGCDIEQIIPLIKWATPHFEKARGAKVDKHIGNGGSAVMR